MYGLLMMFYWMKYTNRVKWYGEKKGVVVTARCAFINVQTYADRHNYSENKGYKGIENGIFSRTNKKKQEYRPTPTNKLSENHECYGWFIGDIDHWP